MKSIRSQGKVVDRNLVYRLLLARMEEVRSLGYEGLLPLVNETVISEPVRVNNGDVWIDVGVRWADQRRRTLCVCGTASGPNCWRMERLDEQMLVAPTVPASS